jgi:arylsulfatase A-like enzyme
MPAARWTRRDALRVITGAGVAHAFPQAQTPRPNILLVYADDLGWGDVSINGRKDWPTPNLDRLAREGTVFSRWYTGAPLCVPSRGCLLTGKYTIHNGVRNNGSDIPSSEVTLAEALKTLGYSTALCGKWHGGRNPTHPLQQGFDTTFGYLTANHAWEHFPKHLFRGREQEQVKGFSADILADEAIRIIRNQRADPFFIYLAFIEPHFNIEAPPEDVAALKGRFAETDPAKPLNATYAAMIMRMDRALGRVLDALDAKGAAGNTIVLVTSDNGATFEKGNLGTALYHDSNRPFRGEKRSLEEGGIREPAVMRWPGHIPAGRRSKEVIHMTDVMPSLLAAAGASPDPAWKVDGSNMLDVWTGKKKAPERTVFWEYHVGGVQMLAAMRGDFKLLDIAGQQFLYNVEADPGERRNLNAQYPDVMKQLTAELKAWFSTEVKR